MSDDFYSAFMMRGTIPTSTSVKTITAPGIYAVTAGNSTAPDSASGVLAVLPPTTAPKLTFIKENDWNKFTLVDGDWQGLGTAATYDITTSTTDNTVGHVLKVGDRGLAMTSLNIVSDFDFYNYTFAASETLYVDMLSAINTPDALLNKGLHYTYLNVIGVKDGDAEDVGFILSDFSGDKVYFCWRYTNSEDRLWSVIKLPTAAADVSAIPSPIVGTISDGGSMADANITGWWEISVDTPSTVAGFPTDEAGSYLYGYGFMFVYVSGGEPWFQHYYSHHGVNTKRQSWSAGPDTETAWIVDYNEANPQDLSSYISRTDALSTFVENIQLGAAYQVTTWNTSGTWPNMPGCVITNVFKDSENEWLDGVYYAPLQRLKNGNWYTVDGGSPS